MGGEIGPSGQRMVAGDRERQIVDAAIDYFAEVGLDGTTRELARRIGITQPLLYRYFPTKQDLLARVYEEIYVNRWNPEWETTLLEAEGPLPERMTRLYRSYASQVFRYDRARLFMFSVLTGAGPERERRFFERLDRRLIMSICIAARRHFGLPSPEEVPIRPLERELVWHLHGGIFYLSAKTNLFGVPPRIPLDHAIGLAIERYLDGAGRVLDRIVGDGGRSGPGAT